MVGLFVTIVNMSFEASFCILAVMLLRLALRRAPKIFSYLLWAVVLVRLVCPVLPETNFGLVPNVELVKEHVPVPKEIAYSTYLMRQMGRNILSAIDQQKDGSAEGSIYTGEKFHDGFAVGTDANAGAPEENTLTDGGNVVRLPEEKAGAAYYPKEKILLAGSLIRLSEKNLTVLAAVWGLAASGLVIYAVAGYVLFMRNIDKKKITTPFVAGLVHPAIYLPEGLNETQRQLVTEHEQIHKKRLDYLIKPVAFLLCCIHWFNPLVWVSFFLMEKDMEASCDEAVIRRIGYDRRKDYANTLLGLSQNRGWKAGCPIAFGENHVKSRIKGVVKMKKAGIGVVIGAIVLVLAAAVLLLVNHPREEGATLLLANRPGEEGQAASPMPELQNADSTLQLEVESSATTPEPERNGEVVVIPDITVGEYHTSEELPGDSNRTYIGAAQAGKQETIMNYDPNRSRDQYEVLYLPQPDEAFNDVGILFSYPVEGARISDHFGSRVHPVSGEVQYHLGVDFAVEEGTPVMAAADGKVVKTGFNADSGNYVILLHENGDATYYLHCKEITVEEDDQVKRGEQIATVGKTGRATGPVVHFAVSRNGEYIEPEFEGNGD